ncbi:MAG: GGDEF domain-containing protein [Lachnospiraceae bacterium]|nr:GGDEF domain-containing protein [Lachnospiraceae bacterium]
MNMKTSGFSDFNEFLFENRTKVNRSLNTTIWFCILTGPFLALGIAGGIFKDIQYSICILISLYCLVIACMHRFVVIKWPSSRVTSVFSLLALNVLLLLMAYAHINIKLTWFFIPLLSIIFCERRIYVLAVISNYFLMILSTWLTAPYFTGMETTYDTSVKYFANATGGLTIETIIMVSAGVVLLKHMDRYLKSQILSYQTIQEDETKLREQMELLNSMAGIYDQVNLIDLSDQDSMSEMDMRNPEKKLIHISKVQTQSSMAISLKRNVVADQLEAFLTFSNLHTLKKRLFGKKIIYGEFISMSTGWFRAQYITVDVDKDGIPDKVIFTIQNIDNEKRREEQLIRISLTDELTRMYNRRCYENDVKSYQAGKKEIEQDFVLVSMDINGLKWANDNKGHAAGDELIKGAADCMQSVVGHDGRVYRVGGDEFIAIMHTDKYDDLKERFLEKTSNWHGIYLDSMTLSVGWAAHRDYPEASIDDLEKIADERMYEEKDLYYIESGAKRRII